MDLNENLYPDFAGPSRTPQIIYRNIKEYLRANSFELYIANTFTRPLVETYKNVVTFDRTNMGQIDLVINRINITNGNILAIGAGTVIDAAKYICLRTASNLYCAPSALSTNSFATHRAAVLDSHIGKRSFDAVFAKAIIIDVDLISAAPTLNLFGMVEIAATAIALVDCKIAAEIEHLQFDPFLIKLAEQIVDDINPILDKEVSKSEYRKLLHCLLISGAITQAYGNGRIVAGSEHIVSAHLESEVSCPHGAGLLIGLLVCRALQRQRGYWDSRVEATYEKLIRNPKMHSFIMANYHFEHVLQIIGHVLPREKITILNIVSHNELMLTANETLMEYFQTRSPHTLE